MVEEMQNPTNVIYPWDGHAVVILWKADGLYARKTFKRVVVTMQVIAGSFE